MKKLVMMCLLAGVVGLGCTDAEKGQLFAYGSHFMVRQYSGGKLIGEWESSGKVSTEGQSDGYYFTERKTGKLWRVSGTLQIEQMDKNGG